MCDWQHLWLARQTNGSATARSAFRRDGAATVASTVPIGQTNLAVRRTTLLLTTSVISTASSDVAVRDSASISRGSVTWLPTAKTSLTKQTVSSVLLFTRSLRRPNPHHTLSLSLLLSQSLPQPTIHCLRHHCYHNHYLNPPYTVSVITVITVITSAKEVFSSVSLIAGLFKTTLPIFMKFGGKVARGPRKKQMLVVIQIQILLHYG